MPAEGMPARAMLGLVPQPSWCNTLKDNQKALPATFILLLVSELKEV